jgi:hypothetical protein
MTHHRMVVYQQDSVFQGWVHEARTMHPAEMIGDDWYCMVTGALTR